MIKKVFTGAVVLTAAVALTASTSFAAKYKYEGGAVANGGSVSGVVSFAGKPQTIEKDLTKEKNKEFCSKHPMNKGMIRTIEKISSKDGKLSGAVVFIKDLAKGKEWKPETVKVDFKTCDIFPRVFTVRKTNKGEKEGNLIITNQDTDTLHNPHGYDVAGANRKTLFNKPLPSVGAAADVTKNLKRLKKKKSKHFFLQCDQHNFMEADGRIVWNPYFQVTGADGAFSLKDVPAGKYKVVAWHPYAGEVTQEVTVAGGADAKADFTIK